MSTRVRIALFIAVVIASGGFAILLVIRDSREFNAAESHLPTSFSYRPLGHRAFRVLLERMGHPVLASRYASERRAAGGLLVLAEPGTFSRAGSFAAAIDAADDAMVVLPKWLPPADSVEGKPVVVLQDYGTAANSLLQLLDMPAEVVRVDSPVWKASSLGPPPQLVAPAQLLWFDPEGRRSLRFSTLIEAEEGILAGILFTGGGSILVLSDPDMIANHGIRLGSNGELAVSLIRSLVDGDAPVVFDETLHGLYRPPSLLDEVLRFPVSLVFAQVLLLCAALIWFAAFRFGRPLSVKEGMEAGKDLFLRNLGSLQAMQADAAPAVRRYFDHAVREAAAVHLTRDRGDPALRIRGLDQIARRRGLTEAPSGLLEEVEALAAKGAKAPEALRLVRRIRRWSQEMMDGTRRTS